WSLGPPFGSRRATGPSSVSARIHWSSGAGLAHRGSGLTRPLRDFALVSRESRQHLILLGLRDPEFVECLREDSCDGVEFLGRDVQVAVRFLEAQAVMSGPGPDVSLGATRDVAKPQRPHELQAGQTRQLLGVPFAEGRVG